MIVPRGEKNIKYYRYYRTYNMTGGGIKGERMDKDDLRDFLAGIFLKNLVDSYANASRIWHSGGQLLPDIRRIIFFDTFAQTVDYVILPVDMEFTAEDEEKLVMMYKGTGIILKLVHCGLRDKGGLCREYTTGRYYSAFFELETLYPVRRRRKTSLTHDELVRKFLEACQRCNSRIIAPYLDARMHFKDDIPLDEMSSSYEFMQLLNYKLWSIRKYRKKIDFQYGMDMKDKAFIYFKTSGYYRYGRLDFVTYNGLITSVKFSYVINKVTRIHL